METSAIESGQKCAYCGMYHPSTVCSKIKAIEYHEDGVTIKRVEFHALPPVTFPPDSKNVSASNAR